MPSTPATNAIGVEKQAVGENLNTWGDTKLNIALQVLANLGVRWNPLTINGDTTISETNYATTNDTEVAVLKLVAGTVVAAFNLVLPGRSKRILVWNASGYTATAKLSATSGVSLPTNGIAWISTDGTTDVYNLSPTHAGTTTQATDSNAYALWGAVQTAIANAALPAASGAVLNSGTDTTAGYLQTKLDASSNASWSTENPVGNEKALLTIKTGAFIDGGRKTSPFTAAINTHYAVCSGMTFFLDPNPTDGAKCSLALFVPTANYSIDPNGKKIGNSTGAFVTTGGQTFQMTYDSTLGDWE